MAAHQGWILHEFTNTIDTKLKMWKCTKKSTKLYFRILIYKNYTLDELNFIQKKKLLTPAHRWQKCARKTLGTHDWICKVALSSKVIMTIVLGREKMMQLMMTFIFSGSHEKLSLVLLQITSFISSSWKMYKRWLKAKLTKNLFHGNLSLNCN